MALQSPLPIMASTTASATSTRPTTPTTPLQIPVRQRHEKQPRRPYNRTPDAKVAALLAVTNIPLPKASRSLRSRHVGQEERMTVDSIMEQAQEAEKEFNLTFSKSPLDLLLSAPEDIEDDAASIGGSTTESAFSTRTVSADSVPSLDSFSNSAMSLGDTPSTPSSRRKSRPTRSSLTPVSSPPGEQEDHPLFVPDIPMEELDFRVFESSPPSASPQPETGFPFRPLRSAFKSNLTASLRALRNAARSFNLNLTSIPPEDFLTRSILTLDPRIPYTDERRPPPLVEEPSAALRRYLNPTTSSHFDARPVPAPTQPARTSFTASIQMQTYKVHRPRNTRRPSPTTPASSPTSSAATAAAAAAVDLPLEYPLPGPRQRELRENSDFIRIAVMEMAMRRKGKLDDRKPGRARLALPPRKAAGRAYEIGADGVPTRWVPLAG